MVNMSKISFYPVQDAYIAEWYPDVNFGAIPFLYISRYRQCGDIYRSLIQFNLCGLGCNFIPPNSCITEAKLLLPVYRNEICGRINVKVFRVLQYWAEYLVTWDTQPLASKYPDGSESVRGGFFGTVEICITDLVRGWYNGTIVNNGLLLTGNEAANDLLGFYSKEYPNTSLWPKLEVCYFEHCCGCREYADED